jgi:prepilin-type N-terminal cleavage/methylation domain-containing protein
MSRPSEAVRRASGRTAPGFTLLEVLVALLVFGLMFGILAQIMRTGLRQSAAAEDTAIASLLARSQLARVGVELPLEPGLVEGEVDGMRWRTAIRLAEPLSEETGIGAYRVDVTIAWGESEARQLTLTTLKLGPPGSMPAPGSRWCRIFSASSSARPFR